MAAPSTVRQKNGPSLPSAVKHRLGQVGHALGLPLASIVFAFLIGALVVMITGGDPVAAYQSLLCGGFGVTCSGTGIYPAFQLSNTLVRAIPLVLTGIAVALPFKAGLFNIGAEGQLIAGAIATTLVGVACSAWPAIILIPLLLVVGALAGALWAGIAGVLKAYTGAHEVVTTIMLNYVAIILVRYLIVGGPFQVKGGFSRSPAIGPNGQLPPLISPDGTFLGLPGGVYQLTAGLFVGILAIIVFWFVLKRTTLGYEIVASGQSQRAARYAGINVRWTLIVAMLMAGAFAGLAGTVTIANATHPYLADSYLTDTTGFDAITVTLLGANAPLGIALSALLIGGLQIGAPVMQSNAGIDGNLVYVLQALILFAIAANFLRTLNLRLPALRKAVPGQNGVEPGVAEYATDVEPSRVSDSG
jgi:ABC-type uncharacterized transport system permease subunit